MSLSVAVICTAFTYYSRNKKIIHHYHFLQLEVISGTSSSYTALSLNGIELSFSGTSRYITLSLNVARHCTELSLSGTSRLTVLSLTVAKVVQNGRYTALSLTVAKSVAKSGTEKEVYKFILNCI